MTVTFDAEQAFWWVALVAVVVAAWCLLADTGMGIARLALDLDKQTRDRRAAAARTPQPPATA